MEFLRAAGICVGHLGSGGRGEGERGEIGEGGGEEDL